MEYRRRLYASRPAGGHFSRDEKLSEDFGFEVFLHRSGEETCISAHTGKLRGAAEQKSAAALIRTVLRQYTAGRRILAAGIGNPAVTPDSLGPRCIGKLIPSPDTSPALFTTVPDIPARTGMDTAQLIRAAAAVAGADCIITVDAMAAAHETSLASVIQISSTGLRPGSGTDEALSGSITKETTGIPVISIGVPTVLEHNGLLITSADCDLTAETFSRVIARGIFGALFG